MVSIERVLERLGIEAKKRAREWHALCPNPEHADRNPSWRIRDEPGSAKHGFHKCWPCGFGGGIADLVQAVLDLDWRAARAWLEEEAGSIKVPRRPMPVEVRVLPVARRAFVLPSGVFLGPLREWPTPAREYALSRSLTEAQVVRWGIGHAVDGPLAGRIVFPYRVNGLVRGYTARTYTNHPRRYKEASKREGADPSAMFGEQHWPEERDTIYVTEGAINAIAVEVALGGATVAAIAGSDLRAGHAVKLATFARLVLLTDPDEAGDKAARDITAGLGRHAVFSRVRLPPGSDAADLSSSELRRCLGAARA
jgi:DNA primase